MAAASRHRRRVTRCIPDIEQSSRSRREALPVMRPNLEGPGQIIADHGDRSDRKQVQGPIEAYARPNALGKMASSSFRWATQIAGLAHSQYFRRHRCKTCRSGGCHPSRSSCLVQYEMFPWFTSSSTFLGFFQSRWLPDIACLNWRSFPHGRQGD